MTQYTQTHFLLALPYLHQINTQPVGTSPRLTNIYTYTLGTYLNTLHTPWPPDTNLYFLMTRLYYPNSSFFFIFPTTGLLAQRTPPSPDFDPISDPANCFKYEINVRTFLFPLPTALRVPCLHAECMSLPTNGPSDRGRRCDRHDLTLPIGSSCIHHPSTHRHTRPSARGKPSPAPTKT